MSTNNISLNTFQEVVNNSKAGLPSLYKNLIDNDVINTTFFATRTNYIYSYVGHENIELQFDGNDYYTLPSLSSNQNFHFNFSFKYGSLTSSNTTIFSLNSTTGSSKLELWASNSDSHKLRMTVVDESGTGTSTTISGSTAVTGVWYNIYINRYEETFYLYVDNTLIGTITSNDNFIFNNNYLANNKLFTAPLFNGSRIKSLTGTISFDTAYFNSSKTTLSNSGDTVYVITSLQDIQGDITCASTATQALLMSTTSNIQSDIQVVFNDLNSDIEYYKKRFLVDIDEEDLKTVYELDNLFDSIVYDVDLWDNDIGYINFGGYQYLYSIGIYKRYFGDFISSFTQFTINGINFKPETSSAFPNNKRYYKIEFQNNNYLGIADTYTGVIYLFTNSPFTLSSYKIKYKSNQLRKEYEINCKINSDEFTYSMNPTVFINDSSITYSDKFSLNDELLTNGGLEKGSTTNWSSNYAAISLATTSSYNSPVYSGLYSLKVTYNDATTIDSDVYYQLNFKDIGLEVNDKIRIEFYIKNATLTANKNIDFKIQQYNGSSYVTTETITKSVTSIPHNEWYRVVLYDDVLYSSSARIMATMVDNPKDSTYFYIDNISLMKQKTNIDSNKLYITTIGLHNDNNDLIAIAKLAKPLHRSTYPMNIQIKFDIV